jgi:hypothetical protein
MHQPSLNHQGQIKTTVQPAAIVQPIWSSSVLFCNTSAESERSNYGRKFNAI